MIAILRKQWFVVALVAAVVSGISFPQAASLNENGRITTIIVALVFLGMGFTLPSESFAAGLAKWKIHLFIQFYIFIFIPAFFYITTALFKDCIFTELYIGLLALAVLPTTISTCSVYTQISNGDVALTLFNASLSNILGILISPILLSFFLRDVGRAMPLSVFIGIICSLALKMILPLLMGQALRFFFLKSAAKLKRIIGVLSNLMVLAIVFFTLAKSASATQLGKSLEMMFLPVLYLVIAHFLLIAISVGTARLFKYTGPEIISVMYAAPQKTIAMGAPLLAAYFADDPALLGMAILPLLFYHPWELFVSGVLKSLSIVKDWGRE